LPDGPYLVVGLARSGVAAALALRDAGRVVACDSASPREVAIERERLARGGVEVHLDTDGTQLLAGSPPPRTLVKSPGVPHDAPVVAGARERGIEIVGELELGWRMLPNPFVAVTGTNGKTTTTELLGAIYRAAGRPVAVAGNVGTPVSALSGEVAPDATVVCEVSSFQLEDAVAFAPETAVFLNFAEDHLDRHASTADYLDAKLRIFANQEAGDVAVVNAAEPVLADADLGAARKVWFGAGPDCDLRLDGRTLAWHGEPLIEADELGLAGAHNLENAMAAAAAALADGVETDGVRKALREFSGLPHRMETVREREGVTWIDDSKATNVAAARAALSSFAGGVHAILGGSLKGGGFAALAPVVAERCVACYLIGEAAGRLRRDLSGTGVELVPLGAGCHQFELLAGERTQSERRSADLDLEISSVDGSRLLATDKGESNDARALVCVGEPAPVVMRFAGAPPGSRVTLLRARWDLAEGLPERWPPEARAAMSAVLREQALGLAGAKLVDESLGVQGPTAMPVAVEPGACYLAVVIELRGTAQSLSLAARAGGREAQSRAPLDAPGTALSFCAGSTSHALVEVEARGLSLVWMSALWHTGRIRLGEAEP